MSRFAGLKSHLEGIVAEAKAAGTYKRERVITSRQAVHIESNGKRVLNFCANNYLGLSDNQQVTLNGD